MPLDTLLVVLSLGTLLAVAIFGYVSAQRTFARLESNSRKSTLAADAPSKLPPGRKPVDT